MGPRNAREEHQEHAHKVLHGVVRRGRDVSVAYRGNRRASKVERSRIDPPVLEASIGHRPGREVGGEEWGQRGAKLLDTEPRVADVDVEVHLAGGRW